MSTATPRNLSEQEWLDERKKVLGASEVAAVLGLSKWATPFDVYASKVLGVQRSGSQATDLGHALQPVIGAKAAKQLGVQLTETEVFRTHPLESWAGATVDYLAETSDGELMIIECKATRDYRWQAIPEYYQTQLAWQCFVHGVPRSRIAVLHASTQFEVYEFDFERDAGWFPDVLAACRQWWHEHVVAEVKPENLAADSDLLKQIQAIPGKTVELAATWVEDLATLQALKEEIKSLTDRADAISDLLRAAMSDAEVATYEGKVLATWKATKPKTLKLDQKAFAMGNPQVYEIIMQQYGKLPEPTRTLLIK